MSWKKYLPAPLKQRYSGFKKSAKRAKVRVSNRLKRPNLFRLSNKERIGIVYGNPSEMSIAERLFLYSLVRGCRPKSVLEIGSRHGGSASIMAAAMMDADSNEVSRIVGVDPGPEILVPPAKFFEKFKLVIEPSPEGIAKARAEAPAPFDFVMIDGLHIYTQVKLDLSGVLPHLADETYILLHDAFHYGVAKAIEDMVLANESLTDCGYPCNRAYVKKDLPLAYGGFRLLRYGKSKVADFQSMIEKEAALRGVPSSPADDDLKDHDPFWYCKRIKRCAYCVRHGLNVGIPSELDSPKPA